MNTATGTPLFHAHAKLWRALGTEALSLSQIADDWGVDIGAAEQALQQLAADHLAFELTTQAGRWRRAWPRFVCLPEGGNPLPNYASYGTSPSMAIDSWGHDHFPALAAEQLVDVDDGIAVAIYHCSAIDQSTENMPAMQIGTVGSLYKRETLIWEGCSYCGGTSLDPDNRTGADSLPCPACSMDDDVVILDPELAEEMSA